VITAADTALRHRIGQAIHHGVEFGKAAAQAFVDQGRLVRRSCCTAPQQIGEPVTACAVDALRNGQFGGVHRGSPRVDVHHLGDASGEAWMARCRAVLDRHGAARKRAAVPRPKHSIESQHGVCAYPFWVVPAAYPFHTISLREAQRLNEGR